MRGASPSSPLQQLRQAPEIPPTAHRSPASVAHPGASATPVMSLLKRLLLPQLPGPFIYAAERFNLFLCSSLALEKQLVTLLAANWQQLFQYFAPHQSPEGLSVLLGFIAIVVSFPPLSCLSSASFDLTPGSQPEESQAGKLRHTKCCDTVTWPFPFSSTSCMQLVCRLRQQSLQRCTPLQQLCLGQLLFQSCLALREKNKTTL